jgi:hypothetical protein
LTYILVCGIFNREFGRSIPWRQLPHPKDRWLSRQNSGGDWEYERELTSRLTWKLTQEAARFKAHHKMSYADCYAAALAKSKKADLVTGDNEFKAIEDQVKIQWV